MSDIDESATPAQDLVMERTFDAPIETVWSMWTDAEHFAAWYGPTGARVPVANMDVRVGGTRHIGMEMDTPNGTMRMWFIGEYTEVSPYTRLVCTEIMSDADGNELSAADVGMPEDMQVRTEVVVELSATASGGTTMVVTHVGIPAGSPGAQGWAMALDKLAARLAT